MIVAWPNSWPLYKQTCFASYEDCCDIVVGPCRCGAWHQKGEFTFRKGVLCRYGRVVDSMTGISIDTWNEFLDGLRTKDS